MDSAYDDVALPTPDCSIQKSVDNNAYLRLPTAYRSLSRLSSAPSAKAFALRPFSLDLRLNPLTFARLAPLVSKPRRPPTGFFSLL